MAVATKYFSCCLLVLVSVSVVGVHGSSDDCVVGENPLVFIRKIDEKPIFRMVCWAYEFIILNRKESNYAR